MFHNVQGPYLLGWFVVCCFLISFFNCMFYQLLRVQHSCSSTQSWGSVLPSIVETRDQNSRGCPLLFSNRNLGSFCAYTHSLWEVVDHSRSKMHETCLIIIHDPGMRPGRNRTGDLWISGWVLYHWANSPPMAGSSGFRLLNMFNRSSQPTITELVVELTDSTAESANLTFRSTQPERCSKSFLCQILTWAYNS